jgi:hypothetical protein
MVNANVNLDSYVASLESRIKDLEQGDKGATNGTERYSFVSFPDIRAFQIPDFG